MRLLILMACVFALSSCGITAEEDANRGLDLARQGNIRSAQDAFAEALKKDPNNLKALYNSGLAHAALGQMPEAISSFRAFLERRPEDKLGYFELARVLALSNDSDGALSALQRSVQLGFDEHNRLIEGPFQSLGSDLRFVALEAVVAQRAGVMNPSHSQGSPSPYGGYPVRGLKIPNHVNAAMECPGAPEVEKKIVARYQSPVVDAIQTPTTGSSPLMGNTLMGDNSSP